MRQSRCRREILTRLKNEYEQLVASQYEDNYLEAIKNFYSLAEDNLRPILNQYYPDQGSRDQAWRPCEGALYEYAVYKCIEKVINITPNLQDRFIVIMGENISETHKEQIVIRNWNEVFPDIDILIIERGSNVVKAILSCKISLRERLTETAFWKREIEKTRNQTDIKVVFITTDKDDELRSDTNRYILLHVIDYTFVTDPERFRALVESYRRRYENRNDFEQLLMKVKFIDEIERFINEL